MTLDLHVDSNSFTYRNLYPPLAVSSMYITSGPQNKILMIILG